MKVPSWGNGVGLRKKCHSAIANLILLLITSTTLIIQFPSSALASGYCSVSEGISISSSPVILGQNFRISFALKEVRGESKTFEQVAVAILRSDNTYVFDFAMYNNVTVPAYGTWRGTPTNQIWTTQPPGTYKAVVRGKVGGAWFDFNTTGMGVTPRSFTAVRPSTDDYGNTYNTATTVSINSNRAGSIGTAGDIDYFRVQVPSSGTLSVYTTGTTDTYGFLKNASDADIASNDDYNGNTNFRINKSVAAGTYYVKVRHYSSAGTGAYTINIGFAAAPPVTAGWSDITRYRHTETTKQRAIVAAALNGGNRRSPLSIATGSSVVWYPDTTGGDGARMRAAIQDVYNYWIRSGRPSLPLQFIPSNVQETMRTRLRATYPLAQQNAFIARIRVVFNGTVPTSDNQTLTYLGIRAQCKEFADRMVQAGGGNTHAYGYTAVTKTNIRPGMYAFKNGNSHAAIIVAVNWDANGQPTQLRLAESNWGMGWTNPSGQVPWSRTIATDRRVPITDYYVVATE